MPPVATLLLVTTALAGDGPVHLGLEAVTDVPWDVGARATLELPGRLRFAGTVGVLPRRYLHIIDEGIIALGGFDRDTADLIEDALSSSLVLRAHLGWRPFPHAGFYLHGGYGLVTLGGGVSGATALSLALDMEIPEWMVEGYDFSLDSTLHSVELELGWEGALWRDLSWRVGLGGLWTVGANTRVEPLFDPWLAAPLVDAYCDDTEDELDAIYLRWVRAPVLSVGLGWRFF